MVQAPHWMLEEKLAPSLFTDNYLTKNNVNGKLIMREINPFILKIFSKLSDEKIFHSIDQANIQHKNISKVYRTRKERIEDSYTYRSYTEYVEYNLFDLIEMSGNRRLDESIARYYLIQIIDVLEQLQRRDVFYVALRQEDIMLDESFNLKLNDFCLQYAVLSCLPASQWQKFIFKTKSSLPPEILYPSKLFASENKKSDVFNIGVILFSIVIGYKPFRDININSDIFYRLIYNEDFDSFWKIIENSTKIEVTAELKDLIDKMLMTDHDKRIGIDGIRNHPWFISKDVASSQSVFEYFNGIIHNFQKIHNKRNLRKKEIISNHYITRIHHNSHLRTSDRNNTADFYLNKLADIIRIFVRRLMMNCIINLKNLG